MWMSQKSSSEPLLSLRHSLICWVRLGFESDTGKDRALVTVPVHVAWQSLRSFHPSRPFQTCTVFIPANVSNLKNLATKNYIFQEVYSYGLRLKDFGAEGRKENSSPGCKRGCSLLLLKRALTLSPPSALSLRDCSTWAYTAYLKQKKQTFETPEIL